MMKKKERRRPYVSRALMWRITALGMGLWLLGMIYLTAVVAQTEYRRCVDDVEEYVSWDGLFDYDYEKDELENITNMLYGVERFQFHNPRLDIPLYTECSSLTELFPRFNVIKESKLMKWKNKTQEWSVALYDSSGRRIIGENNYAYLTYRDTFEEYYPKEDLVGYTYIDLSRTECGRTMMEKWKNYEGDKNYGFVVALQLTGYFDGDEFVLVDVAYDVCIDGSKPQWESGFNGDKSSPYPTVNIYPSDMIMDQTDCKVRLADGVMELEEVTDSYKTNGSGHLKENWDSTEELLRDYSRDASKYRKNQLRWNRYNLFESVITKQGYYQDAYGQKCAYVVSARVQPVRIAMALLSSVYIYTLLFVALILLVLFHRIRRELELPLEHMMKYADEKYPSMWRAVNSRWLEPSVLQYEFMAAHENIRELKKENTQLATALDYAHNAEENRRRMVSNITHELKTPLAVIHSYAEGLKEGIAADKQEHYLDVILQEAERMDGMVLEMLDLSRLEAGKVRLASDRFSLLELTRRVFDKLNLLVEEKELKVDFVWPHEYEITADEGRITQAVTNLVSNAIKYSPRGGVIYVSVTKSKEKPMFSIENQSAPLSDEVLANIWDSFYRADGSRTEKGTGLGLPITKAIIELHGGTCYVANTATGVEFKFYLP